MQKVGVLVLLMLAVALGFGLRVLLGMTNTGGEYIGFALACWCVLCVLYAVGSLFGLKGFKLFGDS